MTEQINIRVKLGNSRTRIAADSVVYAHVQLTGLISDCFFLWQHVFCPEINHHNRLFYNLLAGFDPMRVT